MRACRCWEATATCAITRSRCGIATRALYRCWKARSAFNSTVLASRRKGHAMIDFELTPADQEILSGAHQQALIGRRYAQYYDKHEDELPPEQFPEAKDLPNMAHLAEEGVAESSGA